MPYMAGGLYGFDDISSFINLSTNISHSNYNKIIPPFILSFIGYWENSLYTQAKLVFDFLLKKE